MPLDDRPLGIDDRYLYDFSNSAEKLMVGAWELSGRFGVSLDVSLSIFGSWDCAHPTGLNKNMISMSIESLFAMLRS